MKILFFAAVYEYGGISKIIKNILDNFDRKNFEVVFLVERLALRHQSIPKDVKLIKIDLKPARGIFKLTNICRHLYGIRKIIISEKPDAIVGFSFSVNWQLILTSLSPVKNRPKIILCEYSEQLFVKQGLIRGTFKDGILRCIYKMIMFFLYHKADAIICVSRSLAKRIENFLLIDKRKIKVIYVPVNIKEIRIFSEEKISNGYNTKNLPSVGTISRLSKEKGVNYLIEAFYDLVKKMDAKLIIIGDGEERNTLKEMVKSLGIEDKVSFLGWLENPYSYLKAMDVFVLSSLWEGFPNVVIESMICGVPVVATRSVGGMEEAIKNGIDGLLVPIKDSGALSSAIYRILQDKELKNKLTEKAGTKIDQFDVAKITKEYESVLLCL